MAKPVAAFVIIPNDSGNTGKNIRTQTQTISGTSVHTHFFAPVSQRTIEGVYYGDPGAAQTVSATAHNGTSTGFWWLLNKSTNTVNLGVRRVKVTPQIAATTTFVTVPRVALALVTFTGTPSGTAITAAKRQSADAASQAYFSLASTGATVTLGAVAHSALIPAVTATTVTVVPSVAQELVLESGMATTDEDRAIVSATGEGVVLYQPDAGTTSDTRKIDSDLTWEEFDNS